MANNKIQVKRTNVSGRTANVTSAGNAQYIDAGEFALNMADGILYTSNGSALIEVGANNTNQRITNSLTIDNNRNLRFITVNTSAVASFVQQSDDNFVFYSTNTAYGQRAIFSVFANSITSDFQIQVPLRLNAGLVANGSTGTAGQVLTTNGTTTYWSTVSGGGGGSGTVTSVGSGNGLTGGPITTTGTLSVLANNGITANSTGVFAVSGLGTVVNSTGINVNANNGITATAAGVFVNGNNGLTVNSTGVHVLANTGIVANSTGTFVNATYIGTISANNASFLGGVAAASYVQNTDSRILSGNLNFTGTNNFFSSVLFVGSNNFINTTAIDIGNTVISTTNAVFGGTIAANGGIGSAGQALISGAGANAYWATIGNGTVTSVGSGNGLTGGAITTTGSLSVLANNGITANSTGTFVTQGSGVAVNSTGVHVLANTGIVANTTGTFVNATYIGTISANNASFLGGVAAASYVQNTDSRTLSGNLTFTGITTLSANIVLGTTTITANGGVGTAGQVLTSGATGNVYWASAAGGGYYKGGTSAVGTLAAGGQNIFRVNANVLNTSTTLVAGENAQATGPLSVASGITLTIETGARVSIV